MIPTLERLQVKDAELRRVVDKLATFAAALKSLPILDGALLRDVEVIHGSTKVSHGLGRKPLGWFIAEQSAQTDLWDAAPKDATFLYIGASQPALVDLWVF